MDLSPTSAADSRQLANPARWTTSTLARWFVVIVLAWSAGGKIIDRAEFKRSIDAMAIMSPSTAGVVAWIFPAVELGVAVALVIPRTALPGLGLSLFLGLVFTGLHLIAIISGTAVPCGCIGIRLTFSEQSTHVIMAGLSSAIVAASVLGLLTHGVVRSVEKAV